jgi:hypothetical protein
VALCNVLYCVVCSTAKKGMCLCRMGGFIIIFFLNCYYFIMSLIKLGPF